jgi:signal peptidase I
MTNEYSEEQSEERRKKMRGDSLFANGNKRIFRQDQLILNFKHMVKQTTTFLISLLTPGLGYLQIGDRSSFYKTLSLFFAMIIMGTGFRWFTSFKGLFFLIISLLFIYLFAAVHSTIRSRTSNSKIHTTRFLKLFLTISFVLVTGFSFANRRVVMGFDIMSMSVPAMEPTVLQGERFLVNTWAYKNKIPERGDVVAHSFEGQKGLYLNRIIAKENDKLEIKNGVLFLNGKAQNESYVLTSNMTRPESKDMKESTIPQGYYFVMGDNRDASLGDSRFSGTITISNIEGKITDIISSGDKSRIGITIK